MSDTGSTGDTPESYLYVTERPDGVLEVRGRAVDDDGNVGHLNLDVAPGDVRYEQTLALSRDPKHQPR